MAARGPILATAVLILAFPALAGQGIAKGPPEHAPAHGYDSDGNAPGSGGGEQASPPPGRSDGDGEDEPPGGGPPDHARNEHADADSDRAGSDSRDASKAPSGGDDDAGTSAPEEDGTRDEEDPRSDGESSAAGTAPKTASSGDREERERPGSKDTGSQETQSEQDAEDQATQDPEQAASPPSTDPSSASTDRGSTIPSDESQSPASSNPSREPADPAEASAGLQEDLQGAPADPDPLLEPASSRGEAMSPSGPAIPSPNGEAGNPGTAGSTEAGAPAPTLAWLVPGLLVGALGAATVLMHGRRGQPASGGVHPWAGEPEGTGTGPASGSGSPTTSQPLAGGVQGVLIQGQRALDEGEIQAAADWFRTAIELEPDLEPAHYCLGLCLDEMGKLERAEAALAEARRVGDGDPLATYSHASVLARLDQARQAVEMLESLVDEIPEMADQLEDDEDFDALGDHPRYLALLGEL